jgi:hypothetical protein
MQDDHQGRPLELEAGVLSVLHRWRPSEQDS